MNDTPLQPINVILKSSQYTQQIGTSHYIFELNETIKCYNTIDILMNLDTFQFTNSFYTISNYNNIFSYQIEGGEIATITVPVGIYSVPSLNSYMNSVLTGVFTFSYSVLTYKYRIVSSSNFKLIPIENNIYETLGFIPDDTFENSKTGSNLFNMMNVQQLKICIANINLSSVGTKNSQKLNILYALRVVVGPGEIQNFYNTSPFKYQLQDENISYLEVFILDQNNNPVDFNGVEFFMSIIFSFQYKKQMIYPNLLSNHYKDPEISAMDYLKNEYTDIQNEKVDELLENV